MVNGGYSDQRNQYSKFKTLSLERKERLHSLLRNMAPHSNRFEDLLTVFQSNEIFDASNIDRYPNLGDANYIIQLYKLSLPFIRWNDWNKIEVGWFESFPDDYRF